MSPFTKFGAKFFFFCFLSGLVLLPVSSWKSEHYRECKEAKKAKKELQQYLDRYEFDTGLGPVYTELCHASMTVDEKIGSLG